jgi:hypothetical protein
VRGLTAGRAERALGSDIEAFEQLGYRPERDPLALAATLRAPAGGRDLILRLSREGSVFGGNWGLEVLTAEPVLPATSRGLSARGRGVVRMQAVKFRARGREDEAAASLAEKLSEDTGLGEALARVHFERLSVEPEGRPVIRHMGGSVVWVLFPPVIRASPLPSGQPAEIVSALEEFAAAAQRAAA